MTSREAFFLLPKLFSTDCWRRSWSSSSIHLALEKTLPKESKEKTCHLRSNFGRCRTSRKISGQMMTRREQESRSHRLLNNVFADPVAGAGYLTRGQTPGRLWIKWTYGSDSPGQEFWPKFGPFLKKKKVEPSCDQTWWDIFDFSIDQLTLETLLCDLFLESRAAPLFLPSESTYFHLRPPVL